MIVRLVFALSILGMFLSGSTPARSAESCEPMDVGPPGCLVITRWKTTIDYQELIVYQLPVHGRYEDQDGGQWEARLTPYCRGNANGPILIDDEICVGSLVECRRYGSDALVAFWLVLNPIFTGPSPELEGPVCFDGSVAIPIGPIIADLVETEIGADPPPITLQPTDAIVNLPMIAFTDAREPITIELTDPIIGTATATPEFVWTFAADAAAHGPGRPYDGTSPTANPGYYVTHTYLGLGTPTVGLTVTWRVTFTIPGYPAVQLADVVRESTATTTIRSAGSELIGG